MNQFNFGLPAAASSYAGKIDFGILLVHAAMIGIFVLWGIFFAYLLVAYRRRDGVKAVRDEHDEDPATISIPDSIAKFPFAALLFRHKGELKSLLPDIAVMVFEIALIVFYALPVWSRIKMQLPDDKDVVVVSVVAEQFGWNIHYPGADAKFGQRRPDLVHFSNPIGLDRQDPAAADDIVVGNELHLPVGKNAVIHLTSKDVIHDFFVPEFRIKQDIVPGMDIPLWVQPTKEGRYELACAQLCGFGHSLMRADVVVESPDAFAAWLKSRAAASPAPPKPVKASEDF